jgi:hypothetical protein
MARRPVTVEVEASLADAARAVAERSGVPEGQLYERALREVLVRDFSTLMDDVAAAQAERGVALDDDEAMALAQDELRAVRAERRNAS